ncbi:MAG: hypothetical protein AB7G93_18380 [Bdellovibrionales bacterium]
MIGTLAMDGRRLGWMSAGMLALWLLSSSAWALDLDQRTERVDREIARLETESAQIQSTLGTRGHKRKVNSKAKFNRKDGMKIRFLPASKRRTRA